MEVVVFGNGQQASSAYWYLTHDSQYEVVAFTVDREYIKQDAMFGLPVVPFADVESVYPPGKYKMFVAISYRNLNKLRAEKYYQAKAKGYELISYISSRATTWPGLVVGDNCYIRENAVIQPFAKIGNNVTVGASSLIAHHTTIKDHCYVSGHVAILGSVTVEPYCFIGGNATIRDGIVIARECVVGGGAVILEDTQEGGVYKGISAELLPKRSNELRHI